MSRCAGRLLMRASSKFLTVSQPIRRHFDAKMADAVEGALKRRLKPVCDVVHTLTADNGKGFAEHRYSCLSNDGWVNPLAQVTRKRDLPWTTRPAGLSGDRD